MARELEPHLQSCPDCRAERAALAAVVAELRALPFGASAARTWIAIARATAAERRASPLAWLVQTAALAAGGTLLALTLARNSAAVAGRLAVPESFHPWLLPALFVLFGAMGALAALPLLAGAGRAAPSRIALLRAGGGRLALDARDS